MKSVTEDRDWPWEHSAKGTLRPWFSRAAGYLMVLFRNPDEALRARHDLLEHGVPQEELRLHQAEETLRIHSRLEEERSALARAIAAHGADHAARERYLDNAKAGGATLWIVAPTKDRATRLVGLLADYDYVWLRYLGEHGVEDITWTSDDLNNSGE